MRHTVKARPIVTSALLGLMALALAPTIAQAETSSGIVYHPHIESFESKSTENTTHTTKPKPDKPDKQDNEPATAPESEPESEERHQSEAAPPGAGGNHPRGGDGTDKGGPPKASPGPDRKPEESISPSRRVSTPVEATAPESKEGGGSSPVLTVLIAMAILAAISVGIVLYREHGGRLSQSRPG